MSVVTLKQTSAQGIPYHIHVHAGLIEVSKEYLKKRNYWNEKSHHEAFDASSQHWGPRSKKVPVEVKKELFYRTILPMVFYSNELIMKERQELEEINRKIAKDLKYQEDWTS
jgi:uncharacterized FlgJ-related protein